MTLYRLIWRLPKGLQERAKERLAASGGDPDDHAAVLEHAFLIDPAAAQHVLDATLESRSASDLEETDVAMLMARHAPDALSGLLLAVSADLLEQRSGPRQPVALRLMHRLDGVQLSDGPLRIWRGVQTGIRLADADNVRSKSPVLGAGGAAPADEDPIVELWRALARAVALDGFSPGLHGLGAARLLREAAYAHPRAWAQTLPWLLKAGRRAEDHVAPITAELWASSAEVREAVDAAARHDDGDVRLAAEGLRQLVGADGPANAGALADMASRALDRQVYSAPARLGAPSATWLADLGLEEALRSGARAAVERAAGHFTAMPSTEEEGHVGYLVGRLTDALERVLPQAVRAAAGPAGPQLTVKSRTNGKKEESGTGADVAFVVAIDIRGSLATEFAEAVQVKKSTRLHDDPDRDQWVIKNSQTQDLLDRSPTAVYWLLANDGEVLVVPAKLVAAIARGTGKQHQQTFTVGYAAVRHAAVDLAQFFVDLLVGSWLGSDRPALLDYANGTGTDERPYAVVSVRVTVGGN